MCCFFREDDRFIKFNFGCLINLSMNFFCLFFFSFKSVSPGMVDTELLDTFSSGFKDFMTKLQPEDVTQAILYALGTPDRVQVRRND